ncbi:MAG: NADPH-dependent FMN reductase [Gemmatimonadota bacterium]
MNAPASRICGVAGSLRRESYNRALLRAARELAPEGLTIDIFEGLREIPLFNADLEAGGDPAGVAAWKEAIRSADGLLIVSPEYNGGIPGVLKNAIDWASRKGADDDAAIAGKPTALMGATPGLLGTARAQGHLREVLAGAGAVVMPNPKVLVMSVAARMEDGQFADEKSREFVAGLLTAFGAWIGRF